MIITTCHNIIHPNKELAFFKSYTGILSQHFLKSRGLAEDTNAAWNDLLHRNRTISKSVLVFNIIITQCSLASDNLWV